MKMSTSLSVALLSRPKLMPPGLILTSSAPLDPISSSSTCGLLVTTWDSISETPSDSGVAPGPSWSNLITLPNPLFTEVMLIRSVLNTVASTVKKSTWLVQIVGLLSPSANAMLSPDRVIRSRSVGEFSTIDTRLVVVLYRHDEAALAIAGTAPMAAPATAAPSASRRMDLNWCIGEDLLVGVATGVSSRRAAAPGGAAATTPARRRRLGAAAGSGGGGAGVRRWRCRGACWWRSARC